MSPSVAAAPRTSGEAASCEYNWTLSSSWGTASGKWCDGNTGVVGTVKDTASDGKCPYVHGVTNNNRWVDSDWATGNGTTANVNIWASEGFASIEMAYVNC
ncbi:hypothetical protein [Streptomyces sp. NBC_01433]|uniref:hypothetical protein n=1 Tax=Streptomyces sp. NBC_01433 TaxID=2903864 RepID=UPI002255004C|nr:hypothetical protein [Streptomyces sp. NBC_01433]